MVVTPGGAGTSSPSPETAEHHVRNNLEKSCISNKAAAQGVAAWHAHQEPQNFAGIAECSAFDQCFDPMAALSLPIRSVQNMLATLHVS